MPSARFPASSRPRLAPGARGVLAVLLAMLGAGPSRAAGAPVLPTTPEAWRSAAQADIEAAVQVTRDNHPGMHDPRNPDFRTNLEAARDHGLALAKDVRDASAYVAAVSGFNARIGDGHAGLAPLLDRAALPPDRWPGFVTVWRGDALYVHSAQGGGAEPVPSPGSRLLGCDGKDARQLILDNVFAFRGRSTEGGQWWSAARRLFLDEHNPFIQLPQRCRFETKGEVREHRLAWRALDAEGTRWLQDSSVGTTNPVGMTEPRKNLYWVAMPTFHPNEEERAAYRAMTREIAAQRARYLSADAIVVDLRRNQGGSSTWSTDFARALWGEGAVTRALAAYEADTRVWWRASAANTAHMASLADRLTGEGSVAEAAWAREQATGMRAALARGDVFYIEAKAASIAPKAVRPALPPFTRPLYVVVPGNCASACLDALDVFTRFPNTILMGAPSSADSTYMDVRRHDLASGLASVIVPNKVYVNRPRGNGQAYGPQLPVTSVVWSTPVLLEAVEADLARRRKGGLATAPRR